jgi:hypothetical protein
VRHVTTTIRTNEPRDESPGEGNLAIVNGERGAADAGTIRAALAASEADPVRFGNRVVELI